MNNGVGNLYFNDEASVEFLFPDPLESIRFAGSP
jgi:hypothetical protein